MIRRYLTLGFGCICLFAACGGGSSPGDGDDDTSAGQAGASDTGGGNGQAGGGGPSTSAGEGGSPGSAGEPSVGGSAGKGGTAGTAATAGTGGTGGTIPPEPGITPDSSDVITGFVRDLATDPAGAAYLLLADAPWLAVQPAGGGAPVGVTVRSELSWASRIFAASDGSIYVGGMYQFNPEGPYELQVQRLDQNGELLSSARLVDASDFAGFDEGDDGIVRIGAVVLQNVVVGRLLDNAIELEDGQREVDSDDSNTQEFSLGPLGHAVAAGGDFSWLSLPNRDYTLGLDSTTYSRIGGLAPDGVGGFYLAWANSEENALTQEMGFASHIDRYRVNGSKVFGLSFSHFPGSDFEPDDFFLTTSLVQLADSVVFSRSSYTTEADVVQIGPDGELHATAAGLGGVAHAAKAGAHSAVFVSNELATIYRVTFPAIERVLLPDGAVCEANGDCESDVCCQSAATLSGVCSSDACAFGDSCSDAEQCDSGVCLNAPTLGVPQGFCSLACDESADCPLESFCIGNRCLPTCNGSCDIAGADCAARENTEGVTVTVCGIEQPPEPKLDGETCTAHAECAAMNCCPVDLEGALECHPEEDCPLPMGAACDTDAQCISLWCYGDGAEPGWCTATCLEHEECGTNGEGGPMNLCIYDGLGTGLEVCFAGCTDGDDAFCESILDYSACRDEGPGFACTL